MTRPDFTDWLLGQRRSDDPVGDLARDVNRDPDWPKGATLPELHEHLAAMGANQVAHAVLDRAFQEWSAASGEFPRGSP